MVSKGAAGATRFRRLIALAVLIPVAAGVAACAAQPLSGLFGRSAAPTEQSTAAVSFAPIIGAPANVSQALMRQLEADAAQHGVPVIAGKRDDAFTVRGYLAASPEGNRAKIAYIWDVTDASGKRVHRVTGEELVPAKAAGDPWDGVDTSVVRTISSKTIAELAAWLPKRNLAPMPVAARSGDTRPASPNDRAEPGEVLAYVPAVSGAPGDGQKSLTLAIKKQLFKNGMKVASTPGAATYTVKGEVDVSPPSGGKQSISIEWQVLDPNGRRLGTVSQKNTIAAGALDGEWGATADAAAAAAADGIMKLLPKPRS